MIWNVFFTAIALVMVVEGIIPFLSPRLWRNLLMHMCALPDRGMRLVGLGSMMIGAVLMYLVHSGLLS